MNVNYEYYRLFYYVCKYHSITRAANVLRMSQPNVTRALNRLEEQLGCKLLVRSTRGVTMTPEGEVLFAHVEIAQEQLQAVDALILSGGHDAHAARRGEEDEQLAEMVDETPEHLAACPVARGTIAVGLLVRERLMEFIRIHADSIAQPERGIVLLPLRRALGRRFTA